MARFISIYRRRPGLVDLYINQSVFAAVTGASGITGYAFKAAANFDGSGTLFATVPIWGLKSPSVVDDSGFVDSQFKGSVRFRFAPADYVATATALVDTNPFYLQVAPVTSAGTGTYSAMHTILPFSDAPQRSFILSGTAPTGAGLANSLEVQLPMLCNNFEFQNNDASHPLFVAFESTGAEWQVPVLLTDFTNFGKIYPSVSQIFVRGGGGTAAFTAFFTEKNNMT